jgi:hypothetical protein
LICVLLISPLTKQVIGINLVEILLPIILLFNKDYVISTQNMLDLCTIMICTVRTRYETLTREINNKIRLKTLLSNGTLTGTLSILNIDKCAKCINIYTIIQGVRVLSIAYDVIYDVI